MKNILKYIYYFLLYMIYTGNIKGFLGTKLGKEVKYKKSTKIISSVILGEIILGENVIVTKSNLTGKITIGDYSYLSGPGISIHSLVNEVKIGKFCSIARGVQIQEYNHSFSGLSTSFVKKKLAKVERGLNEEDVVSKGAIIIGNDVWIGTNVILVSGVCVGNGAIIGAGSVVTKDIPDYAIVGGNPARIIKYRFDELTREEIIATQWWDQTPEKILALELKYAKN